MMFRLTAFLVVVLVVVGTGQAATMPTGPVVAETGFNDASGINSDGAPHSPYRLNTSLPGQPGSEPGWLGPWHQQHLNDSIPTVQSQVAFEGDGAGWFPPISNTARQWTNPQAGRLIVEYQMRFTAGSLSALYTYGSEWPSGDPSNVATHWEAHPDGNITVVDGTGSGDGADEDTGFSWVPDQWHKFTQIIDYPNQTWRFFMDDVEYAAPDPLGFRGAPPPLDGIHVLSQASAGTGVYLDELRIMVPEPSTLTLLAMAAIGLLLGGNRLRHVCGATAYREEK